MNNLELLETLITEYFKLGDGELITNHLELIFLFEFRTLKVQIKRKALKHFIESRRRELLVNYSTEEALQLLKFAVSKIQDIFENHDATDVGEKGRQIFSKDYSHLGLPHLRVVYEFVLNDIELVSIHFRKHRKN